MVRGRVYLGGDVLRQRRSASVPAEDIHPLVDASTFNKAYLISSHAVQDADALTAASRRHDRNFLNDISNKLATANLSRPYTRESTPVYIGSRPPPSQSTIADYRRRTWYAPPVSDYEVAAYMAGGPSRPYRPASRGASVPPVMPSNGPHVPKWYPSSYGRSVRGASVPHWSSQPSAHAYSRESLAPYEDVVVGVAHTSLYGDIVIGIPYNKRHMFDEEIDNYCSGNNVKSYRPNFASRHSIATNHPSIGTVSVKPHYRRASVAIPYKSIYDDDEEIISSPSRYRPSKHYDALEYEVDWPERRPQTVSALRGRAQSVQRQLDGIPEFQVYTSKTSSPVSRAPSFRAPSLPPTAPSRPTASYSYPSSSGGASGSSRELPRAKKPPISEARRKVRDLLCKSKNDPKYFED